MGHIPSHWPQPTTPSYLSDPKLSFDACRPTSSFSLLKMTKDTFILVDFKIRTSRRRDSPSARPVSRFDFEKTSSLICNLLLSSVLFQNIGQRERCQVAESWGWVLGTGGCCRGLLSSRKWLSKFRWRGKQRMIKLKDQANNGEWW